MIEPESIKVTPEKPTVDDNITIKVTIHNIGTENVTSAQVTFYDGSPDSNGVQIGTVKSISNLLLGTQTVVTSNPFKLTEGDHTIFIEITNSSPQEFNYTNNQANKKLKVLPSARIPDLMLETNNITFSKPKLFAGDSVYFLAKIANIGIVTAQSATITFYLGDPRINGTQLGENKTLADLTPNNSAIIESDAWIAEEGAFDVFVIISGTAPIELNITNNIANKRIMVNPPIELEYPDLAITTDDIIFLTTELVEGTPIQINAIINNIGTIATSFANVTFYLGNPAMGGTQLGAVKNISELEKDNMISITSDVWYPTIGKYTIFVQISDTKPVENNFTNNNANRDITIQATPIEFDCGLESVDINISTPSPTEGEKIVIIVNIHIYNLITLDQQINLPVRLLVDNITHSQRLIAIDNSLIQLDFVWRARKGEHKITIVLDPENNIIEADEKNNLAVKQIFVQPLDSDGTTDKPKNNQYLSIAIISNVITIFILLIIFFSMINQYKMIQEKQFIKPPYDKKVKPKKSQKRKLKRKIKTEPEEETDFEE
jgi:subtilase family serine protease